MGSDLRRVIFIYQAKAPLHVFFFWGGGGREGGGKDLEERIQPVSLSLSPQYLPSFSLSLSLVMKVPSVIHISPCISLSPLRGGSIFEKEREKIWRKEGESTHLVEKEEEGGERGFRASLWGQREGGRRGGNRVGGGGEGEGAFAQTASSRAASKQWCREKNGVSQKMGKKHAVYKNIVLACKVLLERSDFEKSSSILFLPVGRL